MRGPLTTRIARLERLAAEQRAMAEQPHPDDIGHVVLAGVIGGMCGVDPAEVRVLLRLRRPPEVLSPLRPAVADLVAWAAPQDRERAAAMLARVDAEPSYGAALREALADIPTRTR